MLRRTFLISMCCALLFGLSGIVPSAHAQDSMEQRKEHEKAADKKITELNKKMDELAADARKEGAQARDEINRLYDEFKVKQGTARKDLEEMRKATNETWDKAKKKMDKAIDDLNGLYERAKSKGKGEGATQEKTK